MDDWTAGEGWARYVLDRYEFAYDSMFNRDLQAGRLKQRTAQRGFVDKGGTLILVDRACGLAAGLELGVRNVLEGLQRGSFSAPGR